MKPRHAPKTNMIVEYTRYRIGQKGAPAFLDAHRAAAQYLGVRGVLYELTQCDDEPELYTLRVEWNSKDQRRRFRRDSPGAAFRAAVHAFERDVQERRDWALMGIHSAPSGEQLTDMELSVPARWNRLHAWIVNHLHEHITVERMAEQANMSPRNFARVFRREVLLTPREYLERIRVAAARENLTGEVESLQDVALTHGFGSTSTMLRSFLRVLGVGPRAFQVKFAKQRVSAHKVSLSPEGMLAESARSLSLSPGRSDATMLT